MVKLAKEKSPFYAELYKDISLSTDNLLECLPIIEQEKFWQANTIANDRPNRLLTGPLTSGIIFKSGGTSGNPKFSIFTKKEWNDFTSIFGRGMARYNLSPDDKVANLFYAGNLYASFLFIMKSIEAMPFPVLNFPMAGNMPFEEVLSTICEFKINVLAGVPTSLINLATVLQGNTRFQHASELISKILFGGESLFPEQLAFLQKTFPGARINSIGYASVDGGHLGFFDQQCKNNEHKVFSESIMEIIDENGKVIERPYEKGRAIYTNLSRVLMPIIRYPVGDCAMWTEEASGQKKERKFQLLGRSEEGARIGPVTINRDDIAEILRNFKFKEKIANFQIVIDRRAGLDVLILNFAISDYSIDKNSFISEFKKIFYLERPMYLNEVEKKNIAHLEIEFVNPENLTVNQRTGKVKLVVDRRF
ncbi:MAG: hypothetical protein A2451_14630 [Bdellovibrionales bacterium RIFOXYC2_FULL_39_8]|nr:MAG: hypothetical protein A2451_14630 [Bdellovibrionales bacterium RIFOXYC2_FULL_39_8]